MNAYMHPDTARALLKQSQAYTDARRAAKAEALEIAAVRAQFERIGWTAEAAQELAEIHVRGVQS